MNQTVVLALVPGCLTGAGLWILLRSVGPVQTDLADGLRRLNPDFESGVARTTSVVSDEDTSLLPRALMAAGRRLSRLRLSTPDSDLVILGWSRERFLALRVLAPTLGLALGPVLAAITWLAGFTVLWTISVGESLVVAIVIWWYVGRHVRDRADDARREMRYALVSYINLVALHRAAGAGIVEALTTATRVADSWTYQQIARQIDHSARAGRQPWEGLAELARRLNITELADIGSIAEVSGQHGAAVFDTLLARARSLRDQLLTSEKAAAAAASTRLAYPQVLLVLVVMGFLMYPALTRLVQGM